MGRSLVGALLIASAIVVVPSAEAYFAGGGKDAQKGNDCLIGYDGIDADQVTLDGKKQVLECTDCDPACDKDGVPTANGSCEFDVGVCINHPGVTGCTPPAALDKAKGKGKVKGVKGANGKIVIDASQLLTGSACGAFVQFVTPIKETKKGFKDGTAQLNLSASVKKNKTEGTPTRKDSDKLKFVCKPRPTGESCPIPTTTTSTPPSTTITTTSTSIATTTSTVATTTSTTLASTTSTTLATTTSTTLATTTSTTVPSTTSTTIVASTTSTTVAPSTTSTTIAPTTTSTTIASTTSTTVPTTTSTTVEPTTTTTSTSTTTTIGPDCGNGVINPGEECDTNDFGTATCPGSSVIGAFLVCNPNCTIDFSGCPAVTTTSTAPPPSTTSTSLPPTTTSTSVPPTTTSTSVPPTTTSTSVPPTTTSTSVPPTTTSTTVETSTTSTSTTTPSTTTTSTLPIPTGTVFAFTTGPAGGVCGESREGGSAGTVLRNLTCGGLNIGGGASTVPEGPTPAGATTLFNTSCAGMLCTVTARTAAQTGSNNNCSDVGCAFGPWLSISNGGLSTCVRNTFAQAGSGTVNSTTGNFDGSIPLQSAVTVTGNAPNPCPNCNAGLCDGTASNSGAVCTAVNGNGDTHDCIPNGVALVPFGVDLTPIGTGTASLTGPTFCSGQDATAPGLNGCFANPTCDYIEERGSDAGSLTPGPHAGTLASVFCIPGTGNGLIDGSADLPGPGATSLPGTLELIP